jgi:hypothetical protein
MQIPFVCLIQQVKVELVKFYLLHYELVLLIFDVNEVH